MEDGPDMSVVFIVLILFGFIALMVKWSLDQKREKLRAESGGSSLGTGELRGLIQEAMHDVIAPVEERLDLIEMHMRRLPESVQSDESSGDDT
ncbi:MAG: hypothetical protein BMS9Abin05_2717 [Rhodothermia bacterium]|nr:MAG: hypothetical protein BMS9Abin05_2717 [Rhodothermia bacterium]